MLHDQDPKAFRRQVCLIGESVFHDPTYDVDYNLAKLFKDDDRLHSIFAFAYIAEPHWRNETLELKQYRRDKLISYGCPFVVFPLTFGLSPFERLRNTADYIFAPKLMDDVRPKFSPKLMASVRWITAENNSPEARYRALQSMAEPYL